MDYLWWVLNVIPGVLREEDLMKTEEEKAAGTWRQGLE